MRGALGKYTKQQINDIHTHLILIHHKRACILKPDTQCLTTNSGASMTAFVIRDQAGNLRCLMVFTSLLIKLQVIRQHLIRLFKAKIQRENGCDQRHHHLLM